jgi:peptidylprolyl isomerase domain and WD repeat-containing protein 1
MDSDDDDFGPAPVAEDVVAGASTQRPKRRRLDHEAAYVAALPQSASYEKSYMHRDVVTHISVARATDFVVTGSADGHVKLWKKMAGGVEFVKHFIAHLGRLHALVVSPDGLRLVTTAADGMIKFFDLQSFDMANMVLCDADPSTGFMPGAAAWLVEGQTRVYTRVAVADMNSGCIRVYRAEEPGSFQTVQLHSVPVLYLALNLTHAVVLSIDTKVPQATHMNYQDRCSA